MDRDNREGMEQAIRGAEGLLELGLFTEAEAVFRQLAQEAPEHYRVWLGLAAGSQRTGLAGAGCVLCHDGGRIQ